jgi:hypothetical protein
MRLALFGTSLTLIILSLSSCQTQSDTTDTQSFLGTYQGKLGKSVVTVVINYINGNIVSGYDIVKGVRRNLNGKLEAKGSTANFDLSDPGDNASDGHYLFTLDTGKHALTGDWKPLHAGNFPEASLTLKRRKGPDENSGYRPIFQDWQGGKKDGPEGILTFQDDGFCQFEYYKNEQDSTDQVNTIKGTYIELKKNSVIIEWERNSFFPAPKTTLRYVDSVMDPSHPDESTPFVVGNGLLFHTMAG